MTEFRSTAQRILQELARPCCLASSHVVVVVGLRFCSASRRRVRPRRAQGVCSRRVHKASCREIRGAASGGGPNGPRGTHRLTNVSGQTPGRIRHVLEANVCTRKRIQQLSSFAVHAIASETWRALLGVCPEMLVSRCVPLVFCGGVAGKDHGAGARVVYSKDFEPATLEPSEPAEPAIQKTSEPAEPEFQKPAEPAEPAVKRPRLRPRPIGPLPMPRPILRVARPPVRAKGSVAAELRDLGWDVA